MPRPTLHDVHPTNAALQNVSVAYVNENYIWDQIFPNVPVTKKSDNYFVFDKGSWFRNRSGPRAPGTRAPRADYGLTTASYICINDSLAHPIPDEVRANADSPLAPDVEAVEFITDGLLLAAEVRVAALTTGGSTSWAYSATPSTQWSSDTSDPWGDIQGAKNGVVGAIGRMPNVCVMSWDVWRYLENHPDFLDRVKYTRNSATVTTADLEAWFGFTKVLVGTTLVDTALEGETESIGYVWGDQVWIGYVTAGPALRSPTAGYVLTWGSRTISRYREDQEHQDVIEIEHFTDEVITASDAGGVLSNCV